MSTERPNYLNLPGMAEAVDEIEGAIRAVHPAADFQLTTGEDPEGLYVSAVVDAEDLDGVVDLFVDRLIDLQVDRGLPLYVLPVRPVERVTASPVNRPTQRRTSIIHATPTGI
jgi:hypothetical protein